MALRCDIILCVFMLRKVVIHGSHPLFNGQLHVSSMWGPTKVVLGGIEMELFIAGLSFQQFYCLVFIFVCLDLDCKFDRKMVRRPSRNCKICLNRCFKETWMLRLKLILISSYGLRFELTSSRSHGSLIF